MESLATPSSLQRPRFVFAGERERAAAFAAAEALAPELILVCSACAGDLPLDSGLGALETLWMHEHECPAAAPVDCDDFACAG